MAQMLKNRFVKARNGLDFSRSLFPYEKRHSTNLLSGYIVPVHHQFLYPGMSPDYNFGCVVESAPLISTNLDNIYVDIVCIWTPVRLVMTDWNEFLGESNSVAFTINRNITIPKLTQVYNDRRLVPYTTTNQECTMNRAYLAEHFLGPHLGFRFHGYFNALATGAPDMVIPTESIFKKGISVLPSRAYELNWNTFFRNENIQAPILINKTSLAGIHDATYKYGLGPLQIANKLKNFYTVATPAPSLMDVSIAMDQYLAPVGVVPVNTGTASTGVNVFSLNNGQAFTTGEFVGSFSTGGGLNKVPMVADLSLLTVNRMYYALMEQRFANKMMKGRRAVEFYKNFFGIESSDAAHDLPQLICQKRFPLNISMVIATANSKDIQNNDEPIGSKGAYSVTGFGGSLIKNFTASEHGFLQTYMIIRGQPSLSCGIDKYLGYDSLLDTYIPEFDHIGPVGIEQLEISEPQGVIPGLNFGFTNAWYSERKQVSDVVGIIEPTEPLSYKTLSLAYNQGISGGYVINDSFLRHVPTIIDRIFLFPVCGLGTPGTAVSGSGVVPYYDEFGEPTDTNCYQFITQFVVKGQFAAVMSPDSEPFQLRL